MRTKFLILFFLIILLAHPKLTFAATDKFWNRGYAGTVFDDWGACGGGSPPENCETPDFASICAECGPMGAMKHVSWNRINPGEGIYNWTGIENALGIARQYQTVSYPDGTRKPMPLLIQLDFFLAANGDLTPDWVYTKYNITRSNYNCSNLGEKTAPAYENNNWQEAFYALLRAMKTEFNDQPNNYPNLAGILIGTGYDSEAYPLYYACNYPNSGEYHRFLRGLGSAASQWNNIPIYFIAGGEGYTGKIVEAAEIAGAGVKTNTIHQGNEFNGFSWVKTVEGPDEQMFNDPRNMAGILPWSWAYLTTNETSWGFEDARSWGFTDPKQINGTYYQLMMMLNLKADFMDFRDYIAFKKLGEINPYFLKNFVPSYIGRTKLRTPGAWIGFTDIHNRAPIKTNDFPDFEAERRRRYDGPKKNYFEVACWTGSRSGDRTCYTFMFGNHEFYMKQVDNTPTELVFSDELPSPANYQSYGYGKTLPAEGYFSLKVDDGVWFKNEERDMKLRIIFLNQGAGSIELEYKSNGEIKKEIIEKGTGLGDQNIFIEKVVEVPKMKFDGGFTNGGDVLIRAKGDPSTIHLYEVRLPDGVTPPAGVAPTIGSTGRTGRTGAGSCAGGCPEPTPTPQTPVVWLGVKLGVFKKITDSGYDLWQELLSILHLR